jgi:uncharacterized protein
MTGRSVSRPNRVFIDTSAYFALINENDISHEVASEMANRLSVERKHLFTSNFVIAETHALVLSRLGRDTAFRVLTELDRSNTTMVRVSSVDERRAREIIARFTDKSFSLTDATSFAIMDRLKIGQAFSLDDHFAQYGFTLMG